MPSCPLTAPRLAATALVHACYAGVVLGSACFHSPVPSWTVSCTVTVTMRWLQLSGKSFFIGTYLLQHLLPVPQDTPPPPEHIQALSSCPTGLIGGGGQDILRRAEGSQRSLEGHLSPSLPSFASDTTGWGVSPRGAGYLFGSDVVAQFNAANDIDMICRAHQLVMEGYKWHFNETVLTVWSAPNYCYR